MSLLLAPLAVLYGMVVSIRNKLFDWGVLRSCEYDIPVVCVGNLTVGGTGKTPVTQMLVEMLSDDYRVAVLSRGYGRRTRGYIEVETSSSFLDVGDEPKQTKRRFPHVVVAVCERRATGIARIRADHPDVDLVVMDDGFQHRWVEPWVNVVLMDYNRPVYCDRLLPWGRLRDRISALRRAHCVVVTKCPDDISPLDMRLVGKYLELLPSQGLFFTRMHGDAPVPVFADEAVGRVRPGDNAIALSGIGNPAPFEAGLGAKYNVAAAMALSDHHIYRDRDMAAIEDLLKDAPRDTVIITTEKDAVKLTNRAKIPLAIRKRLYYLPIDIEFINEGRAKFTRKIREYVRSNPKYGLIHR